MGRKGWILLSFLSGRSCSSIILSGLEQPEGLLIRGRGTQWTEADIGHTGGAQLPEVTFSGRAARDDGQRVSTRSNARKQKQRREPWQRAFKPYRNRNKK